MSSRLASLPQSEADFQRAVVAYARLNQWLIVGGESGPGHRPMRLEWARDLRDLCAQTGTACFVKQLGGARPGTRLEDLPEDLRVREFPT